MGAASEKNPAFVVRGRQTVLNAQALTQSVPAGTPLTHHLRSSPGSKFQHCRVQNVISSEPSHIIWIRLHGHD